MTMDSKNCKGCYNDFYNGRENIAGNMCMHLETATMVLRKEVHRDQPPPWNHEAREMPSCYQGQDFHYVRPDQTGWD